VRLQCLGVCDSSGAVRPAGSASEVDDASLALLVAHKASGGQLAQLASLPGATPRATDDTASAFLLKVAQGLAPGALLVDCTASEATLPALLHATSEAAGLKVVLANKKPLAASGAAFAAFRKVRRTRDRRPFQRPGSFPFHPSSRGVAQLCIGLSNL
jgi:aspartokinase/homoserine dehydrogenase 1